MPLLRFTRLPQERQDALLDAAEACLVANPTKSCSLQDLIGAMNLPRASAYSYFEGREDVIQAVVDRVGTQLGACLGQWTTVDTPEGLWTQWQDAIMQVIAYLTTNADHAVILRTYLVPSQLPVVNQWVRDVLTNAAALGMVNTPIPEELLFSVTLAILQTLDSWVLDEVERSGQYPDFTVVRTLMEQLWGVR